ncbi:MAG: response regulator transcription factor [Xanthomonadales bacterium]|nr:response regulator transcription factor [Gammaproteobacteria bacterium]MBT8051110.1 response regulator transcription factor [Gammaproteobacteria bacterium]MBT8057845.1 response regulator transcription factor [Gammaproteobacteria bacterium]NNJ77711.1 response regulator transcription factor [Xanthomonadales bacterium]NNL04914.1 response regulator transcription factor [Xanthomonadales bacterium]
MRVLVIEDSVELARQIKSELERLMYVVDVAYDGEEGQHLGATEPYDAVILDLGIPKRDGLAVLENWRDGGVEVPVIVLTSRKTWRERVMGLRAGADDYIGKPFEYEELEARLEAVIRRSTGHATSLARYGGLVLDPSSARVTLNGDRVELTALEYRTLGYLLQHQGEVVSKARLTEHIYHQDFDLDSNVIEVLINRLRKKLAPGLIYTRRGLGYQLGKEKERA